MGEPKAKLSAAEFLAWEHTQEQRHIFYAGEVFAMAGGTAEHNAAAGSVFASLRSHLKGSTCRAFIGDMRVQIAAADAYFYPDVVVTCAPQDVSDPKFQRSARRWSSLKCFRRAQRRSIADKNLPRIAR